MKAVRPKVSNVVYNPNNSIDIFFESKGLLPINIELRRGSLPITLEKENDNSMGEGREVQGREIPAVHIEPETDNGAFRF